MQHTFIPTFFLKLCAGAFVLSALCAAHAHAQGLGLPAEHAADIRLERVEYDEVGEGVDEDWLQIELTVEHNGPKAWADNVGVHVTLAFENRNVQGGSREAVGEDAFVYFKRSATLTALERGKRKLVHFFLPGEVRERYRLAQQPAAGVVEFTENGRTLGQAQTNLLGSLTQAGYVPFSARAARGALKTHNQLLPFYLTPQWVTRDDALSDTDRIPAYVW